MISLIIFAVFVSAVVLSELTGYYWLVIMNSTAYLSFDRRPLQSSAFGVMAGSALSFLGILVFSRRGFLPLPRVRIFTRILPVVIVVSWSLLVSSYAENLIYPGWFVASALTFFVTLGALTWRTTIPRGNALVALVLALTISSSLAVPGYLSAQRTTLWAASLGCNANRCPFGLADPTSPGPPWGQLVQGHVYDFYFDVIQGQVEIMLTSAPGTGSLTYWNVGGDRGLSNWNGVGVTAFEWSPGTTGYYQIVISNQNYPSSSLTVTRITTA
jgi:hypothetical protein